LSAAKIVIVPLHLYESHWAICIVDLNKQIMTLKDSLNYGHTTIAKRESMEAIL
jgi:Ulp1 family protease